MGYPEDNEVDPKGWGYTKKASKEEVRQALTARGYTEIDIEVIEAKANRKLEELHVQRVVNQFKFDFSRLVVPKKQS